MQVGFGKQSFFELLQPRFNSGFSNLVLTDELSLIALVATTGSTTVVLIVGDCESFAPPVAAEMRAKLATALNLPVQHIALFATQNHCAPLIPTDRTDDAVALCVKAVNQALAAQQPAEMLQLTVHPEPALNFCRRLTLPDQPELGAFTFWSGYRQAGPGQADVSYLLDCSLKNIAQGRAPVRSQAFLPDALIPAGPTARTPVLLARAHDDALQALFFRTPAGTPIGCLLRFATHPCTGEPPARFGRYSGDFPVYARRKLEREFGGQAVFLTGPCGDANPLIERRSLALAEQYGEQVAAAALQALPGGRWTTPDRLSATTVTVRLPVRSDWPRSMAAVTAEIADLTARLQQPKTARENKPLLDRLELLTFYKLGAFNHFTLAAESSLQPEMILEHPLPIIQLGPATIAGLPGEPFSEFGARLRRETLGDALIVCDQANGYVGYVPTAAEVPRGSYGVNYSLFDERAETLLLNALKPALQS